MPADLFGRDVQLGRPFGFPLHLSKILLIAMGAFAVFGLARRDWPEMLWLPVLAFFIFLHELGHAVVARHFGSRVNAILLHVYGGLTLHTGELTARQSMIVSLTGPAVNLGLAVALFLVVRLTQPGAGSAVSTVSLAHALLLQVVDVNLSWGIFNLLPIWPLDGGQIARVYLLRRLSFPRARLLSAFVSLTAVVVAAVFALLVERYRWMLLILAGLAYLNVFEYRQAASTGTYLDQVLVLLKRNSSSQRARKTAAKALSGRLPLKDLAQDADLMRDLLQRCQQHGIESLTPEERRLVVYHRNMIEAILAKSGYQNLSNDEQRLLALHHELDRKRGTH